MNRESAAELVRAARALSIAVGRIKFEAPAYYVYNPLEYARLAHELYLNKYGRNRKRVVFLGMNPGPYGMLQTGVPFGEVNFVRQWMDLHARILKPARSHPKRPVEGFACKRSEVSGRRLWGLFEGRFESAANFFRDHFVANYCPLAFFDRDARNLTPDKLPTGQTIELFAACDRHLRCILETLQPQWLVGIGGFAAERARLVCRETSVSVGRILHPSPASPAANRNWAEKATAQLKTLGAW